MGRELCREGKLCKYLAVVSTEALHLAIQDPTLVFESSESEALHLVAQDLKHCI